MKWPLCYLQPLVKRLDSVCAKVTACAYMYVCMCVWVCVQGYLRLFSPVYMCVFMYVSCVQGVHVYVHRGYHHTVSVLLLGSLLQAGLYGLYSGQLVCRYIGSLWPSRCSANGEIYEQYIRVTRCGV